MTHRLEPPQQEASAQRLQLPPAILFAAFDQARGGWCIFESKQGATASELVAGPFQSREAAEAQLGPSFAEIHLLTHL